MMMMNKADGSVNYIIWILGKEAYIEPDVPDVPDESVNSDGVCECEERKGGGRYKCEPLSQAIQEPGASKAQLAHASPYHADRGSSSTVSTTATTPWHPHHADQPASSAASF